MTIFFQHTQGGERGTKTFPGSSKTVQIFAWTRVLQTRKMGSEKMGLALVILDWDPRVEKVRSSVSVQPYLTLLSFPLVPHFM
jgi:hypothetical protein